MTTAIATPRTAKTARPSSAAPSKPRFRFGWLLLPARTVLDWFPVTPRGLLLLGVCAGALYYADSRRDVVLLSAGLIVAGWMALAAVLVLLAGLWLQLRREVVPEQPLELEAEQPWRTDYSPGLPALLPVLSIDVRWREPLGVEVATRRSGLRIVEEVTAHRRGEYPCVRRVVRVADLFGMVRVVVRRRWARKLRVLPGAGAVDALPLPRNYREGEETAHPEGSLHGDRVDQRRYQPGDPLKVVLWKALARTGRMLVRTPERALSPVDQLRAYLVSSDDAGARPSDEATAGTARAALLANALGDDYVFAADGDARAADNVHDAIDRIVTSGAAHGRGGDGLPRFLDGTAGPVAACLLFVPARPGRWLAIVEYTVRTRPGDYWAVVGIDGPLPACRPKGWVRLVQCGLEEPATAEEVTQTCDRLKAAGIKVLVVDRTAGRIQNEVA
jgi:hypothetical protein